MRIRFLSLAVALTACAPQGATPGGLAAPGLRVSNEVIEADLAMIAIWRERLDVARERIEQRAATRAERSGQEYALAKADAWLSFARDEYATEPRGAVADAALERARKAIELLEQDSIPAALHDPAGNTIVGTAEVHPELWRGASLIRADSNWSAVAVDLAELEVALVRAGRVMEAVGAACRAETHVIRARRILARVNLRLAEMVPVVVAEAPKDTTPPEPVRPQDRPVTISVHFALDRAELSAASGKLLDEIVKVLRAHPEYGVVLEGHADPRGRVEYNLALSRRRVESVRDYLAAQGVIVDRLDARARGTSERAASGTSLVDYALDRRVTLQFLAPDGTLLTEGERPSDLQVEEAAPAKSKSRTKRSGR